jgi:hypothetical protein
LGSEEALPKHPGATASALGGFAPPHSNPRPADTCHHSFADLRSLRWRHHPPDGSKARGRNLRGAAHVIRLSILTSVLFTAWARIRGHKVVRLYGHPRPGGHMFVTSPDLPGFSVMLRPGEHDDASSVIAVLDKPLKVFLMAEARGRKKMRVTAVRETAEETYLAELCPA